MSYCIICNQEKADSCFSKRGDNGKFKSSCKECFNKDQNKKYWKITRNNANVLAKEFPELLKEWHPTKNQGLDPNFIRPKSGKRIVWICPEKRHEWVCFLYERTHGRKCPHCQIEHKEENARQSDQTGFNTLKQYCASIHESDINQVNKRIFFMDKKFVVQFNKLIEGSCDKGLLSKATKEFRSNDCQLFHIFKDEWQDKRTICESMIISRLKQSTNKIAARKCTVSVVDKALAREFFDKSHIAGNTPCGTVFGLFYESRLVSALGLRNPVQKKYDLGKDGSVAQKTIEIGRFASEPFSNVMGGFSKLLSHAKEWALGQGYTQILTYADLRFGVGNTYMKAGFQQLGPSPLDYWYSDGHKRMFRFKFRAQNGLTEKEYAQSCNVFRVYGCGSMKFLLALK